MGLTIEPGVAVVLRTTTRSSVEFFARRELTPEVEGLAARLLDVAIECLSAYEQTEGQKREASEVMRHLAAMEARQKEVVADAKRTTLESVTANADRSIAATREAVATASEETRREMGSQLANLERGVGAIESRVGCQMLTLIQSVEQAVKNSVEKLDAGSMATRVSEAVRGWMTAEFGATRQSVETLRVELERTVAEPMRRHVELTESTRKLVVELPDHVLSMFDGSMEEREGEIEKSLADMRKVLQASSEATQRQTAALSEGVSECGRRVQATTDEVTRMWNDEKERSAAQKADMQWQAGQAPAALKAVLAESLRDGERQQALVRVSVEAAVQQLATLERNVVENRGNMCVLRKASDDTAATLLGITRQLTVAQLKKTFTHTAKGHEGESRLFDMLSDRLQSRDGYELEMCNGVAHQCDMRIKRLSHPEVRIESKAIGQETGEKCRHRDVAKFQSDLMGLNAHGIFVSLHAGIVGKSDVEVELMANNRFAVYLGNNNYNIDQINDMLQLIYRLDKVVRRGCEDSEDADEGFIRVSPEAMKRVTQYCKDFASKITAARNHMKESMGLLSELTLDAIEKVLLGQMAITAPSPVVAAAVAEGMTGGGAQKNRQCAVCGVVCQTAAGLGSHMRKHRLKPGQETSGVTAQVDEG